MFASLAQVAIDCLTGFGRMPSEGEALIKWMQSNESQWRLTALKQESDPDGVRND